MDLSKLDVIGLSKRIADQIAKVRSRMDGLRVHAFAKGDTYLRSDIERLEVLQRDWHVLGPKWDAVIQRARTDAVDETVIRDFDIMAHALFGALCEIMSVSVTAMDGKFYDASRRHAAVVRGSERIDQLNKLLRKAG